MKMGNMIRHLENLINMKIMRELGLWFSLLFFSKFCVTQGIYREAVRKRTSEFNCIKGD